MFRHRDGVAEEERVQPSSPLPFSSLSPSSPLLPILQRIISAHVFSARDSSRVKSETMARFQNVTFSKSSMHVRDLCSLPSLNFTAWKFKISENRVTIMHSSPFPVSSTKTGTGKGPCKLSPRSQIVRIPVNPSPV